MEQRVRRVVVSVALVAAIGILSPPAALAATVGEEVDYSPAVSTGGELDLLEAVRLTLENEPSIRLQAEDARLRKGILQETTGAFDLTFLGSFEYEYTQQELTKAEKDAEEKRREELRQQASDAGDSARDGEVLRDSIDNYLTADDECLANGTCSVCSPPDRPPISDSQLDAAVQLMDFLIEDACARGDVDQANRIAADRDEYLYDLKPEITADAEAARATEATNIQKLEALGRIPDVKQAYGGQLDLRLSKPYRTGIVVTPYLTLSGNGSGYQGKPKDSDRGGTGVTDTYEATLGFTVDLPLARGKGVESAGAAERAATIDYEASLSALTHSASVAVYRTVLAYWNLVAAQKSLRVWEMSLELQNQLVELTKGLIEADEMARAEIIQAQARQTDLKGEVDNARRQVYEARVNLARTIGLEVQDETLIPMAGDDFPAVPSDAELELLLQSDLAQQSVANRYDYRAARQLQESGKVLLKAAEIDLAPVVDLNFDFFFKGLHEDANPLQGLDGALFGNWVGPSGKVGLNVEKPLANNTQLGRLAQQNALYRRQAISSVDLERVIKANVVLAEGQLREAMIQLERTRESIDLYRQTYDNELEKLRFGSSTIIDTILTEQRLTDSGQAWVSAGLRYAQILAQLRFESGTLVTEGAGGKMVSADSLVTLPLAPAGGAT
jgi:outer membrane protein TolC